MWNLKYDTSELIYKTETDLHTQSRLAVAKKEGLGEERTGSVGLADANSYMYMCIYNIYIIHIYNSKKNIYI